MRFDAFLFLVMDWTKGEIAFEILESLFNGNELQIVVSELCGLLLDKIGAQQISAFAPARLFKLSRSSL